MRVAVLHRVLGFQLPVSNPRFHLIRNNQRYETKATRLTCLERFCWLTTNRTGFAGGLMLATWIQSADLSWNVSWLSVPLTQWDEPLPVSWLSSGLRPTDHPAVTLTHRAAGTASRQRDDSAPFHNNALHYDHRGAGGGFGLTDRSSLNTCFRLRWKTHPPNYSLPTKTLMFNSRK